MAMTVRTLNSSLFNDLCKFPVDAALFRRREAYIRPKRGTCPYGRVVLPRQSEYEFPFQDRLSESDHPGYLRNSKILMAGPRCPRPGIAETL